MWDSWKVAVQVMSFVLHTAIAAGGMRVHYSWVFLDYAFPTPQHRASAVLAGTFVPENCVVLDVDVFTGSLEERFFFNFDSTFNNYTSTKKRVFVTVPRLKPGNPASIAELVPGERFTRNSALLSPFPNWKTNTVLEGNINCDETIVSVFRTRIDNLGRFWIVDVGRVDQFDSTARTVCPPKLLIYDLKNGDKLIRMHRFISPQLSDFSLLTNIEVDVRDSKGRNTFAYISDISAYKLVVYDFKNDDSWVVDQAYFYPYPNKAHFSINGVNFDIMDGILGLALGPVMDNHRKLYFHPFASTRESWVSTEVLQNKSMYRRSGLIDGTGTFFVTPEVRKTQSSVEVITDEGVLIYTSMDNSLGCWNTQDPFTEENLYQIYKNDEEFQLPSGLKIVGDQIWAVSSQLQNLFSTSPLNRKSVKYRVLSGQVDELLKGKGCDKSNWSLFG